MIIMDEHRLQGMGQFLIHEGILDTTQAIEYHTRANQENIPLLHYLIKNNLVLSQEIAHTVTHAFGFPLLDIHSMNINTIPMHLVSEKLIHQHRVVPLYARGNYLYIATDDPFNEASLKEIQFHTGLHIHPIVVESDALQIFIEKLLTQKKNIRHHSLKISESLDVPFDSRPLDPAVQLVNSILLDAVNLGVSDIHFESFEYAYRIRYRHDGMLREVATPPYSLAAQITSRIKVMSQLDTTERRIPQDGSFKMYVSKNHARDFRVSTCPMSYGEKVVIRILDPHSTLPGIEALGFNASQKDHFIKGIKRPQGMILVTGPTGSGKTLTLYTALNLLNKEDINISTVEDPIEIKVPGINQVAINSKIDLSFSKVLRSFLRQDPDIIYETAEIAIQSAQTGHLVLSSVHTNSASETLTRLSNMGITAHDLASSVNLIVAQRLVRVLCPHCKMAGDDILNTAVGCNQCHQGYKGRVGLFEVLPVTQSISDLIMSGASSKEVQNAAQAQGMQTLYESGLEKVRLGITTIEEVNRVTVDTSYV